jgi:hypothetical protein
MSENSVLCEASGLVRQIAAPATGKAALLRAYRKIGTWTYNRVKDVYYADRRIRISADEIDGLRAIALGKTEAISNSSITEGKRIATLEARVSALEAALEKHPPDVCDFCGERGMRKTHSFGVIRGSTNQLEVWTCEKCRKTENRFVSKAL